ncbi:hypothetical protein B0H65DRAFT_181251 [Neurospora tetraspora]|uniref:Uncharacterized protein n=1 Tax=Neurospora tetraspora TaxID=94610 RepID=A0AAE0JE01_9PEZI|nr:hypothetical protein B0H65DRAFT_181251 [Neurospora tetraspora]
MLPKGILAGIAFCLFFLSLLFTATLHPIIWVFGGFIPYLMCEISRESERELGLRHEDHVLITCTVTPGAAAGDHISGGQWIYKWELNGWERALMGRRGTFRAGSAGRGRKRKGKVN